MNAVSWLFWSLLALYILINIWAWLAPALPFVAAVPTLLFGLYLLLTKDKEKY